MCREAATTMTTTGDDDDDTDEPISPLDPNAPPVLVGDWVRPPLTTSWQWQLQGPADLSFDEDLYDLDLFDTPAATLASLQQEGRMLTLPAERSRAIGTGWWVEGLGQPHLLIA